MPPSLTSTFNFLLRWAALITPGWQLPEQNPDQASKCKNILLWAEKNPLNWALFILWLHIFEGGVPAGMLMTVTPPAYICICRPRGGDGECKREDRRVTGSGWSQIKPPSTEEQNVAEAKCCHGSSFPFRSSPFSPVAVSVKHNIMQNNSLQYELAAGVSTFHHSSLFLTVLQSRNITKLRP